MTWNPLIEVSTGETEDGGFEKALLLAINRMIVRLSAIAEKLDLLNARYEEATNTGIDQRDV